MDAFVSPFITIIANIIADVLVSKGIIDAGNKAVIVQNVNTVAAAIMTLGVAIVSIVKVVDLAKHKITMNHSSQITSTATQVMPPNATLVPQGQSGIIPPQNVSIPPVSNV